MDLKKFLKWHLLGGPLMRRVVLRAFMLVLAVIVVCLTQMTREIRVVEPMYSSAADECPFDFGSDPGFNLTRFLSSGPCSKKTLFGGASPVSCRESENLTRTVFKELMEKKLLQSNAGALCVGPQSASAVLALRHLGFFNAFSIERHPFFSLLKRRFVYELDFQDNLFDFVFSDNLDRVSVPALLVSEIERVLRPGGTGAMLVGPHKIHYGGFMKSSDIIHACEIGSFSLLVFKKRLESFAFQLPEKCASVTNNGPYMKYIERPLGFPEPSYLPNYMNISSRSKLVYINLGAGEYAKTSVAKMSKTYCGDHHAAFEVYVIDHRASVLSSYVTDPGINFVYHPELSGNSSAPEITSDEFMSAPSDDEGFDFARWFDETISEGDFVVLMMKAESVEMDILVELFKTGGICRVDELFLRCPDSGGDCTKTVESLRKSGVYAHVWLGD
ncbi:hypothetical protein ABFS83_04G195500 [Erythranthe nasuta]